MSNARRNIATLGLSGITGDMVSDGIPYVGQ